MHSWWGGGHGKMPRASKLHSALTFTEEKLHKLTFFFLWSKAEVHLTSSDLVIPWLFPVIGSIWSREQAQWCFLQPRKTTTCGVDLRTTCWQDTSLCFDSAKGHQDDEEGGYIMGACVCVALFYWPGIYPQLMQHHTMRGMLEGMKREIKKTHLLQQSAGISMGVYWLCDVLILKHAVKVTRWDENPVLTWINSNAARVSDACCQWDVEPLLLHVIMFTCQRPTL